MAVLSLTPFSTFTISSLLWTLLFSFWHSQFLRVQSHGWCWPHPRAVIFRPYSTSETQIPTRVACQQSTARPLRPMGRHFSTSPPDDTLTAVSWSISWVSNYLHLLFLYVSMSRCVSWLLIDYHLEMPKILKPMDFWHLNNLENKTNREKNGDVVDCHCILVVSWVDWFLWYATKFGPRSVQEPVNFQWQLLFIYDFKRDDW